MQDLIDRYSEAWGSRDPDEIVALHTEDTEFQLHMGQERAIGKAAVRETFAGLFEQIPDLAFEQRWLRTGADFWAVEWRITGTAAGLGAPIDATLADVVTVEDGLVKTKDSYVDAVTLQAQLGAAVAA
jgi:steroid delta-isomerase-like uncharacterized protein